MVDPGTRKGGAKVSSAKCEQLNPCGARKIWGLCPLPVIKARGNPILSPGSLILDLRRTIDSRGRGLEMQAISTISHGQSLLQPQLKPRYGWSNKVLSLQ